MNKLFYKFSFLLLVIMCVASCTKSDGTKTVPLRDYNEQYLADLDSIDKYIDTHYITVDANFDIAINDLPDDGSQQSIRNQTQYPLQFRMYYDKIQDVNYKIYYINLREGIGQNPCPVDSIHVSYRGKLATSANTQFDYSQNPIWFTLDNVVSGWSKIIPMFKTGTYTDASGPNPITYQDFGAGVMFLPSGLAYYANSSPSGSIPAYSPLVFSFKLYELQYRDQDRDGIFSKDEVPYGSPSTYNPLDYDSDEDGFANMNDINDDGDFTLTKNEIKDVDGNKIPFDLVPDCSGNTTNPERIRKYLDPSCH
jgi:FKBP-type peptidyl-prolyl cis-trans isomerase